MLLSWRVSLVRSEIATMKKPDFPFIRAAKTGLMRSRDESTSSYRSASGTKKPKVDDLIAETTQRKLRPKELKTGTNTNSSVISGAKRPPKPGHNYVGRLSQHIYATEMEEY